MILPILACDVELTSLLMPDHVAHDTCFRQYTFYELGLVKKVSFWHFLSVNFSVSGKRDLHLFYCVLLCILIYSARLFYIDFLTNSILC